MPHEVVRQRIKYLIEHGELYPHDGQRLLGRRIVVVGLVLLALNAFESAAMVIKYFL
jgi:hypothetical protein